MDYLILNDVVITRVRIFIGKNMIKYGQKYRQETIDYTGDTWYTLTKKRVNYKLLMLNGTSY